MKRKRYFSITETVQSFIKKAVERKVTKKVMIILKKAPPTREIIREGYNGTDRFTYKYMRDYKSTSNLYLVIMRE